MSARIGVSARTRRSWLIDATAFTGGLVSVLTGIYFLFLPSGGYEGGRNPMYGITILFDRHTWENLHTWGSLVMIAAVAVHLVLHWPWVRMTARRVKKALLHKGTLGSGSVKFNIVINALIGISFFICALSGAYFLLAPSGGFQGGSNPNWDPGILFSRTTWDLIHTWSGVLMSAAIVVHFAIHWRWVKQVTRALYRSLVQKPEPKRVPAAG